MGFGDIGPSAAEEGLPYLRQALRSSEPGLRYLAVEALSKLGPPAEPLLREAAMDTEKMVREHAARVLASPGR